MKCIKRTVLKNGEYQPKIVRTSDKEAAMLVDNITWHYVSKSAWKRSGRKYIRGGIIRN